MMTTRVVTLRKCPMCKQYYSKRCLPEMEESEELEYSIEANEKKCAECTHLMQRYSSCGPHVMVIQMGGNKMQEAVDTLANVLSSHLAIGNQCYRKVLPDELYDLTSCEKTLQSMSLLYRVSKRFSIVPISSANSQLQVVFSLPAWGSICVKCPEDQSFSENSAGIRSLRKSSVIGTINLTKNQASSVKIDGLITSWYSIQISKVEGQVSLMCESSFCKYWQKNLVKYELLIIILFFFVYFFFFSGRYDFGSLH